MTARSVPKLPTVYLWSMPFHNNYAKDMLLLNEALSIGYQLSKLRYRERTKYNIVPKMQLFKGNPQKGKPSKSYLITLDSKLYLV